MLTIKHERTTKMIVRNCSRTFWTTLVYDLMKSQSRGCSEILDCPITCIQYKVLSSVKELKYNKLSASFA